MKTFEPTSEGPVRFFKIFSSAIAPRPIAFVSTISSEGVKNLSPFSYFNFFSANPPVLVFSVSTPASGGQKDTLRNVRETGDCIVHIADRSLAHQLNLSSAVFEPDIDEFERTGLTPVPGDEVTAFRVAEAKVAVECRVRQIIPLGDLRASGNLVICDVVKLHVDQSILFEDGSSIDPHLFPSLARLGGEWYMETQPDALFELPRPPSGEAMGVGGLRRASELWEELSLAERSILGTSTAFPDTEAVEQFSVEWSKTYSAQTSEEVRTRLLDAVRAALADYDLERAWLALLAAEMRDAKTQD